MARQATGSGFHTSFSAVRSGPPFRSGRNSVTLRGMDGPRFYEDGNASMVVDDRHLPILIVTYRGTTTERMVREYFAWMGPLYGRLAQTGDRMALITDVSAASRPSPVVRRLISEFYDHHRANQRTVCVADLAVVHSAVVRGAITAIQWLTRSDFNVTLASDLAEACALAGQALRDAGVEPPTGLDPATYTPPVRAHASAG